MSYIFCRVSLALHLKAIHTDGVASSPYNSTCTKCNVELLSKESLRAHVQQYHGPAVEAECPECNKTFANQRKLIFHMPTHKEKLFQCTECPKSFRQQSFLDKHSVAHSDFRAYVCEQCGTGLKTKNALKRHISGVHEMKKQVKYRRSIACTMCDVKFPKFIEAKEHFLAEHTRAAWKAFRSLVCGCCYIRFASTVQREEHYSQYLANHDKSKSRKTKRGPRKYVSWTQTERPHQCDICKNTYSTPATLNGHMKMHHNKPRPFKCEVMMMILVFCFPFIKKNVFSSFTALWLNTCAGLSVTQSHSTGSH